jgi:hypothetical protein
MIILANLAAVIHGFTVAAVVVGSLAAMTGILRRYPRCEQAYYGLLGLVVASDIFFGDCLLTDLERHLRQLAGPGMAYRGSFIGHYLPWLPPWVHARVGPVLVVGALLAWPAWRWADRRRLATGPRSASHGSAAQRSARGR